MPLGKMLLFGGLVGVATMVVTQAIMSWSFDRGFWNPQLDEFFPLGRRAETGPGTSGPVESEQAAEPGNPAVVVSASGMGDILGRFFSANSAVPLLTVWLIAAVLPAAVGSIVISSITAASLLAPVAAQIGLDPVLVALAAGAGSMFLVHVTSNTFWLLQSLLGQTTRGAFKTVSIGVSAASVVASRSCWRCSSRPVPASPPGSRRQANTLIR